MQRVHASTQTQTDSAAGSHFTVAQLAYKICLPRPIPRGCRSPNPPKTGVHVRRALRHASPALPLDDFHREACSLYRRRSSRGSEQPTDAGDRIRLDSVCHLLRRLQPRCAGAGAQPGMLLADQDTELTQVAGSHREESGESQFQGSHTFCETRVFVSWPWSEHLEVGHLCAGL